MLGKMKILIVEDDTDDCNSFIKAIEQREEFEIIGVTDSDIEALNYVRLKHPDGIILDLELNNSRTGNTNSLEFIANIKELKLEHEPIIIVTTHVHSKRTYEILHRLGIDLILYKNSPKYSCDNVLNTFLLYKDVPAKNKERTILKDIEDEKIKISNLINHELDLIGVTPKLKGRKYIHDAILYLVENENSKINVIQYLTKIYKKSGNTITNGIQNAIIHAWRVSAIEDLETYYTAKVNYETGVPTPMEFIYYYVDKIKKLI